MKRKVLAFGLVVLFAIGTFSTAKADTVLFPVIVTNYPYVTTIVSVTNQGPTSTYLNYIYSYKSALIGGVPNYTGGCAVYNRVRPTWPPDVVSFDASGTFNAGWALFNDPDGYGGPFHLPQGAPPYRSYLLVTNSDAAGNRVNVGSNFSLRGEAIVMDIFSGAAWGYRAVNDQIREDFTFDPANLPNALDPGAGNTRRFSFFPPNEWTTRFFVTPVGANMHAVDLTSTINLYRASPIVTGIHGRGGNIYAFDVPQLVRCTAAVDLRDLMDATAWAALFSTGGWGRIGISDGSSAYIYKLEYVVNNPTYGGTNNNAYLVGTD